MSSYTKTYSFEKIDFNYAPWDSKEHANWDLLDSVLTSINAIPNVSGVWRNSTVYNPGQVALDATSYVWFACVLAHTSAGSGTFEDDRLAHPTYWSAVISTPSGAVRYDTAQALAPAEKTVANTNIGALPLAGGTMTGDLAVNKTLTVTGVTNLGPMSAITLYVASDTEVHGDVRMYANAACNGVFYPTNIVATADITSNTLHYTEGTGQNLSLSGNLLCAATFWGTYVNVSGGLTVSAATDLQGVVLHGALSGLSATMSGDITAHGFTSGSGGVHSTADIVADKNVGIAGTLGVGGTSDFTGLMSIHGAVNVGGAINCTTVTATAITASGNLGVSGNVQVNGTTHSNGALTTDTNFSCNQAYINYLNVFYTMTVAGTVIASAFQVDPLFNFQIADSNRCMFTLDTNDWLEYARASNRYRFLIGASERFNIDPSHVEVGGSPADNQLIVHSRRVTGSQLSSGNIDNVPIALTLTTIFDVYIVASGTNMLVTVSFTVFNLGTQLDLNTDVIVYDQSNSNAVVASVSRAVGSPPGNNGQFSVSFGVSTVVGRSYQVHLQSLKVTNNGNTASARWVRMDLLNT